MFQQLDKQLGFTLIEVVISLILLSIITTIAVPSMSQLLSRKDVRNAAKAFEESLRLGSSESRTRLIQTATGQSITLCPYNTGRTSCIPPTPDAATGNNSPWRNNGWVLFVDIDKDNQLGNVDTVLNVTTEYAGEDISITFTNNPTNNRIKFGKNGPIQSSDYAPVLFSNKNNTLQQSISIDFNTGQSTRIEL